MKPYLKIFVPFLIVALAAAVIYLSPQIFGHNQLTKENGNEQSLADFYQKSRNLGKTESTTATFLAVGDIMLSRNVAGTIAKKNDPLLPFRNTENLLRSTDFNFGNLESPLSGRSDFNHSGSLVFNAPPAYAIGLKTYNFQILNLANNHAMDQGKAGIDYTMNYLDQNGLKHIGTGDNLNQAWTAQIVTAHGIKVGFIGASFSSLNDGGKMKNDYVARIEDTARLQTALRQLKQQADFIVVTMHAGTEYTRTPNAAQIAFAHTAINNGADIVIGAHPHWVQTTENYNGKYIFYSLGNFIFDQEWSQETKEGLTLKITVESQKTTGPGNAASIDDVQGSRLGARLKQIELIPVIIENYSTPRLATDAERTSILQKIKITNPLIKN